MQCPGAACVSVANCFACHLLVVGLRCDEYRREVGTVADGQRSQAMLARADLDVLSIVAFDLGEQDKDLAEVGGWRRVPRRYQSLLCIRVEYHVCCWPGTVAPDKQRFPGQGHIWAWALELFFDVAHGSLPSAAKVAQPVIHASPWTVTMRVTPPP